jgi:2-polyprenyl-6-methoxyphenol hydroxylase-like FAD-dependent oxidoreductase
VTVATVSRYDEDRIVDRDGRAVVIGAGVAGLLAARVLADAFETVTVIERDSLSDELEPRRGAPQGHHVHVLLEGGRTTIDDLCPGFSESLVDEGGVVATGEEFEVYVQGGTLATTPRQSLHLATRALYERTIRRHVASNDRVELRVNCRFLEYVADEDATAVEGVTLRNQDDEVERLAADLVVDATGRTSRTPSWLEAHGYEPPPVDEIHIGLGYASAFVERPPNDRYGVSMEAEAPRTRGAFVFPVENDRWLVNVHGVHGDHPSPDLGGLEAFAESLPLRTVADLLGEHPLADGRVTFYPFPSSRRYRYAELDRFPDGLVVVGDGIASFNPVNGQGMSVAALEALLLHRALAERGDREMALRFFRDAAAVIDIAWELVAGSDLAFPQTDGSLPRRAVVFDRYLNRLIRSAHDDTRLAELVWSVFVLERPPSVLFQPRVLWRVLAPARARRHERPQPDEPPRSRTG